MTTFKSGDGREIDEEDVRRAVSYATTVPMVGSPRPAFLVLILAALAPKPAPTCGAMLVVETYDRQGQTHRGPYFPCVLPPGHHPFRRHPTQYGICDLCSGEFQDDLHAPGHMPSADSWREPK